MSNTLIPKSFPHFVPDQVLTDTQLNSLRDYLDTHDRLTRTHLVGTGIVCGLHIAYARIDGRVVKSGEKTKVKPDLDAETHTISVSAGYGITSLGYLIIFPSNSYTRYRQYEQVFACFPFIDDTAGILASGAGAAGPEERLFRSIASSITLLE